MPKSEPKITQVVVSHASNGHVNIKGYGDERSGYSVSEGHTLAFDETWTQDEIREYVEKYRASLRNYIDGLAQVEHDERFNQSFMAGG